MCYGMGCHWENRNGECTKPIGESCAIIDGWEKEEESINPYEDPLYWAETRKGDNYHGN